MKSLTQSKLSIALAFLGVVIFAAGLFGYALNTAHASAPIVKTSAISDQYRAYQFFASTTAPTVVATTTSAVSTSIIPYFTTDGTYDDGSLDIRGAKKVNFFFSRGDTTGQGNSGSSAFSVQVMGDGVNWVTYPDLKQLVATSTNALNRVSSVSLTGTTTVIYTMDTLGFQKVRCVVVETTDGEHTCAASVQY